MVWVVMKTIKHLMLGALSCLLLAVGFANLDQNPAAVVVLPVSAISPGSLAHLPTVPQPGDGTTPLKLIQPA